MMAHQFYDESDLDPQFSKLDDEMSGVLIGGVSMGKQVLKRFERGEKNIFKLEELISAAGLKKGLNETLGSAFPRPSSSNQNWKGKQRSPGSNLLEKTLRETGVRIQVDLSYNNIRCDYSLSCSFGTVPTTYRYRVSPVPSADFEVVEVLAGLDYYSNHAHMLEEVEKEGTELRIERIRRGVYIQVEQGGKIGRFSLQVFVVNLCSGLGMATLVAVVLDFLALNVLPKRALYNKLMVTEHLDEDEVERVEKEINASEKKNE